MISRLFASSHIEDYLHGDEAWAVVTGSTDGIGKATANTLLSKGFNVLIHGRNPTKLSAVLAELKSSHPNKRVESVLADFSNLEDVFKIPDYIMTHNLRVTLFINNVAYTTKHLYLFEDTSGGNMDALLSTGVVFFTKLCYQVVPIMKKERVGGIAMMVNIGSAAAEFATPYLAVYSGTKGFVLSITRVLGAEARLTSSNITYLYIDVHSVATVKNTTKQSIFVPSAEKYAESLVFCLGKRSNRKRGSDVIVTPYWGHELERILVGFIPASMIEKFMAKTMTELKERFDRELKRDD